MCICPLSLLSNLRVHYCPIPTLHRHDQWHTVGDDLILYTQQARSCGGGKLKGSRSSRLHLCKVPSPSPWYHYPTIFVSFGRKPAFPCTDILLYDSRETMFSFKVKSDFKTHPKWATSSRAFSLQRFLRIQSAFLSKGVFQRSIWLVGWPGREYSKLIRATTSCQAKNQCWNPIGTKCTLILVRRANLWFCSKREHQIEPSLMCNMKTYGLTLRGALI